MFNHHDINRDACMLHGPLAHHGYDWWWHSFTAQDAETGEDKPFFIEFFICNPALAEDEPVLGQLPANKAAGKRPSYLMVKAGTWGPEHFQLHRFFSSMTPGSTAMPLMKWRLRTVMLPKLRFGAAFRSPRKRRPLILNGCATQEHYRGI